MWIRSQDKRFLGDYKEVYIVEASIMGVSGATDDTKLGDYETPERAMEVLDEIQQLIAERDWIKHLESVGDCDTKNYQSTIYEIPKE